MTPQGEGLGGVPYTCGSGTVFVYESVYAGTNKATAVNFNVPLSAFDDEVGALRDKGITFLTFEALEGMEWNEGVASMGGAMKAIWEAGLKIPNDIAVVGAGDVIHGDLLRIPLTTVAWSRMDLGREAAELLLDASERPDDPPRRVIIPPHLVVRESCGGAAIRAGV